MKKLFLINILSLLVVTFVFADHVSVKDAQKVAKNHYYQSFNNANKVNVKSKSISWEDIDLKLYSTEDKNFQYDFYAFNVGDNEGYVIVSSESSIKPVLAYSFEGNFDPNNMAPAQKAFLDYYSNCIKFAATNEIEENEIVKSEWVELIEFNPYTKGVKEQVTSPNLLEGINWNQGWPYNSHCPEDSRSDLNGRVPVGCVAVSMLQIMKYYNWPLNGTGTKYYNAGSYGAYNIDFSSETYNWTAIPDNSAKYNEDLGKINLHAGVSVNMGWGYEGSGAYTEDVPSAFKNYFRYSSSVKMLSKRSYGGGGTSYSDSEWIDIVKEQIDAKKPVIYAGSSTSVGHAWNCDGYQERDDDTYLHMNWGWGGSGNGYCTIDELISSATPGGSEYNFVRNQRLVINIFPDSNSYPEYCVGAKTITGFEGTFDDGSSIYEYKENLSCVHVIKPDCGNVITVNFLKFDLGSGDCVDIYDGDENSNILLASYSPDNLPGNNYVTGNSGAITIRFNTDGISNGEGWKINYTVKNCADNFKEMIDFSGAMEDGSNYCEYQTVTCSWKICPPEIETIKISFEEFNLAFGDDIKVYRKALGNTNLLYTFSSSNEPVGEYTINCDTVIIRFNATSATSGGQGWKLKYETDLSNIETNDIVSDFYIAPNPGNENSKLVFNLNKNSEAKISVITVLGNVISSKDINLASGINEISLRELSGNLVSGVYYINVQIDGKSNTTKFVVLD